MKMTIGQLAATTAIVGLTITGCPKVYTQADIEAAEFKEDSSPPAEAVNDEEIGEEGGVNQQAIDDEKWEVERQTDL